MSTLPERRQTALRPLAAGIMFAVAAALVTVVVGPLAPAAAVGLLLAAVGVLLIATRPWLGFTAYLLLLAPHVLFMALLYGVVGLPPLVVRLLSAWKEGLLLLLLASILVRPVWPRRLVITLPDLVLATYLSFVLFATALALLRDTPLSALAYGVRDLLLPVAIYLVGRTLPLDEQRARWVFRLLLGVGLALAVLGIIERQLVPTEAHVWIGIPAYYRDILGLGGLDYLLGLPANYWTSANSGLLRRAVSVYGSSQPFALSFLLFLPPFAYALLTRTLPERRFALLGLLIMLAALALTITRFTIVIALGQLVLMGLLLSARARRIAWRVLATVLAAGVAVLVAVPAVRLLVINTLTFQDHSSSLRLQVWGATLGLIFSNPIGYGIATTGQTASRFGGAVISIEGQYSKIGVELGLIGLLLYIAVLATLSLYLLRGAYRVRRPYLQAVSCVLAIVFIGLAVNSMTTEWHNSIALVYPLWWLAGSTVATLARSAPADQEG
jgi:hypothetical protein